MAKKETEDRFKALLKPSLLKLVLCSWLTAGLYYVYYQHKLNMTALALDINPYTEKAIRTYGYMVTLLLVGFWLVVAGGTMYSLILVLAGAGILAIALLVNFIWLFTFRKVVNQYMQRVQRSDVRLSKLWLAIFQVYYIVWFVNQLKPVAKLLR